jgi:hypothetical protein
MNTYQWVKETRNLILHYLSENSQHAKTVIELSIKVVSE